MRSKVIGLLLIAFTVFHGNTLAQAKGGAYSRLGSGEPASFPLQTEASAAYHLSGLPQIPGPAGHEFISPFQAYPLRHDFQADQNVELAEDWEIQTPDLDLDTGANGNSIVVNAQGRPGISYEWTQDFSRQLIDLRYVEWDGLGWQIQTVHRRYGEPGGYRSSLALDGNGAPHISYHVEHSAGQPMWLRHTTRLPVTGAWGEETLDEFSFGELYDSSIALGAYNRMMVLYNSRTLDFPGLRFIVVGGASQQIEPPDLLIHMTHNSLARSSIGRPHAVYHVFDGASDVLKYATPISASGWQTTVIDQNLGPFGENAIAVDAQDRPRIAYADPNGDKVKYAVWDGTTWQIEVVTTDYGLNKTYQRSDISLAIDPYGAPHILYTAGGALKYAVKKNGAWMLFVLHPGPVGLHSDLAVDSLGHVHVSFFDLNKRRLKYARSPVSVPPRFHITAPRAGDTWVTGSTHTIAWQAENMPEDVWVGAVRLWWDTVPVAEIRPPLQQSPATGSLQWRVPDNVPPGDYYLVEAILNRGTPGNHTQITDAWAGPFYVRRP